MSPLRLYIYKVDCNTLGLVLGTKYKSAWDKINKAKKPLIAAGFQIPAGASAGTPKKRKNEDENGVEQKTPTKRGAKAKKTDKVEEEGHDAGKKEESDED